MCTSPITLLRPYKSITGELTAEVPCGRCLPCLRRRTAGWTFRLKQEAYVSTSVSFWTFTYDDISVPVVEETGELTLEKKHFQDFMKRLRWNISQDYIQPPKLKYYACGEYGPKTHRPHYHAIIFNLPKDYNFNEQKIDQIWDKGKTEVHPANDNRFAYVAKYCQKEIFRKWDKDKELRQREFSLMSKGIGKDFLTDKMINHIRTHKKGFVEGQGYKTPLPRYYRERIYKEKKLSIEDWQELKKVREEYKEKQKLIAEQFDKRFKDEKSRNEYKQLQADRQRKIERSYREKI